MPSCSRSGRLAHGNGFDRIKISDYVVPNRLFTKMSCHLAHGYRFDRIKMSDYVVPNRLFTKMSCHLAHGYRFDHVCVCGGGGRQGERCVCTCDSRYFMIFLIGQSDCYEYISVVICWTFLLLFLVHCSSLDILTVVPH